MKKIWVTLIALCVVTSVAAQKNPLRDSLAQAKALMEEYPDSVDLRLKKAGWNMQLMEWQYAKDEYDVVLRRHPDNVSALFFQAYANERLGRYNFARLDYQNLLTLVPATSMLPSVWHFSIRRTTTIRKPSTVSTVLWMPIPTVPWPMP